MTKHFCDRCGKECQSLAEIKIPAEKVIGGFSTKPVQVCTDCKKEYDDRIRKCIDIRFVIFDGFMKGGKE